MFFLCPPTLMVSGSCSSALGPRCRDAFLLYRVDGVRHDEIAARFGVTVRTVERDIAKALDHLTARLSR